ncbi:YccF domain-containing protein [Olivibacter sp. SDN3]|uniref:YccF domain-containing protein n=1 Tax=Olivibacter sp. SDN3 TaxID=2764720 RepID=UPI00165101C1|nr:YccF domain-containing protein [Olivibacter sp. SDN3]QNL49049.1 YccF domain-containing protein [Olivibacter sp. SDN3]
MNLLGNLIWLLFGGFFAALGYLFGGIILCITIIGIPFGIQCFKLAGLALFPFGKKIINQPQASGCLNLFANLVWILCGGLYTALNHLFWATVLAISIIGIPFAKQHLKLLEVSLMPFGKKVID